MRNSPERKPFLKRTKNDLAYGLALAARALATLLPRFLGLPLFGLFGRLFFLFPGKDKRRTVDHLRGVYGGQWSEKRIRRAAAEVYANLGKNLFDALYLAAADNARFNGIVTIDSCDDFDRAYAQGRGLVMVAAHLGCFELVLQFFARRGVDGFAIGSELYDPRLDALVTRARHAGKVTYLHRTENPRTILRLLSQGKAFGVLIDQDTRADGVFAYFLGRLAYTPSGPVKLAMRLGLPLFVGTTARMPDNTHRLFVGTRVELENTGDADRDLVCNVQRVNDLICEKIERYPLQWVWMHRRWRRRPEEKGAEKVLSAAKYLTRGTTV